MSPRGYRRRTNVMAARRPSCVGWTAIRKALSAHGSGKRFVTASRTFTTRCRCQTRRRKDDSPSTRSYATPRGILMRCEGTAVIMTRGPALAARDPDQLLIVLQIEGSVDTDSAGRCVRREAGDVAISDYARPFHSVATDYAILIVHLARESVPAALLALEPHGLVFPRGSGAARLIGTAMQELYAQADHLTVSEAEAAIEGIAALTTAFARARLAGDEADHVKSRRKVALDYIDAHLGNPRLGPDEIVDAVNL